MKILTYETQENSVSPKWSDSIQNILIQAGISDLVITPVSKEFQEALNRWNGVDDLLMLFTEHVPDNTHTRLFISAPNQQKYRTYCIKEADHARWGCCLGNVIAIEYAPLSARLPTQIHETLHLFGVDECYDESTRTPKDSCNDPECLMRYGVQSTKVCKNVLLQLRN